MRFEKKLINFCEDKQHLIIYGAGRYATAVLDYLMTEGIKEPEVCIVSERIEGTKNLLDRIPIMSVDEYMVNQNSSYSIVLALQSIFHDDVREIIAKYFGGEIRLLPMSENDFECLETAIIRKDIEDNIIKECAIDEMEKIEYEKKINWINERFERIEISYIRMYYIGDAFDWIRLCAENKGKKDKIYRVFYPVTFPHMKLEGANAYMLRKFSVDYQEVISKSNRAFWSYYYSKYPERFLITKEKYSEKEQSELFNRFATVYTPVDDSFLNFEEKECETGENELERMGIIGKYICFCIRDSLYRDAVVKQRTSMADRGNKYRNSSPEKYRKAMEDISRYGYQAVRMGALVESPLEWENVIDYAYNYRNDFLDLYLMSKCEFLVCNPSGIQALAQLFSKPLVSLNAAIITTRNDYSLVHGDKDLAILAKYYNPQKGRFLTIREMLVYETNEGYHEMCSAGTFLQYERDGVIKVENTPEEIEDVIIEMIGILNGTYVYDDEDIRLQNKYKKIIKKFPMGNNCPLIWRIGAKFLRENQWLLD